MLVLSYQNSAGTGPGQTSPNTKVCLIPPPMTAPIAAAVFEPHPSPRTKFIVQPGREQNIHGVTTVERD
jgi:hypothetical protein